MAEARPSGYGAPLTTFRRAKPAKPGEIYGVPGQGDSLLISAVVITLLLCVWWFITATGVIKPLFLPSPMAVLQSLLDVLTGGFTGSSFWEHVWISTARVFGAFLLACAVGIPLGILAAVFARRVYV